MSELSPQMKRKDLDGIYPDWFGDTGYGPRTHDPRFKKKSRDDGTEEYEDAKGKKRSNVFGDGKSKREQAESLTDPLRIEQQKYNDNNRKLNELMTLYNAAIQNPNEQGNKALEMALKDRIGVIDAARANRFSKESSKTYIDEGNQFDTPYTTTYTNPDIPTFGGIGDSNPPGTKFPRYSTDLGSSMIRELVGAFFGNRSFNVNNIKGAIINKIIGNDGKSNSKNILGSILTDGMVSSKKGAYVTTTKALKPLKTETPSVFKKDKPPGGYGISSVIKRLL
jgi:hypothetical protein